MRPFRLLAPLLILISACAQVAEITGGPKDEDPPRLVAADPPHLSTGFNGDRITLVFNERIQLERVRDRLLISPPLPAPPLVRMAGPRTVTIDIDGALMPNTTYSFVLGGAVKDLAEGNPALDLTHVISTGPYVDSMLVAGRVINAFSGDPEKEVLVMVYAENDTATIRNSRPAYATRTNAEGYFTLRHLRDDEYRLHALRDQNTNYRFDLPNEEVAFLDSTLRPEAPDSIQTAHELRLFREMSAMQQVRESRVIADGALRLILERPSETVDVVDIARTGGNLRWIPEWNAARDTLLLWPSDTTALQEGRYRIATEDGIIDTLRYRIIEKMPFFTGLQASLREMPDGPVIRLRSARPILSVDSSRFQLLLDSVALAKTFSLDTADRRNLYLAAAMEPGDKVELRVLPRGITDIYGGHNDTLLTGLGRAAEQSTGILLVRVRMFEDATGPFILQLLDRQGVTIREERMERMEDVLWERVPPGEVRLRLIGDRNGNGRWDPGVLDEQLQPEPVWNHGERVNVRASWEIGIDWEIGKRPLEEEEDDPEP